MIKTSLYCLGKGSLKMGGGVDPIPVFFFGREILKSVYNGLIHPENFHHVRGEGPT